MKINYNVTGSDRKQLVSIITRETGIKAAYQGMPSIPEQVYDLGNVPIDMAALQGRDCYGGLDLSSTGDITAFVLMFPPRTPEEKYVMLPFSGYRRIPFRSGSAGHRCPMTFGTNRDT